MILIGSDHERFQLYTEAVEYLTKDFSRNESFHGFHVTNRSGMEDEYHEAKAIYR